ncbi:MAG: hypothetical protein N2578_08100 [Bdellovibrionaceae bacterium]|nr:hypothetical protein [Pseudobdellovibrionaceae bacterium]
MKVVFLFLSLFISSLAFCAGSQVGSVVRIVDERQLELDLPGRAYVQGALLGVLQRSGDRRDVYKAFLRLRDTVSRPDGSIRYLGELLFYANNSLIREGDPVEIVDLSQWNPRLAGNTQLLQRFDRNASLRYRPSVYLGLIGGVTAEPLLENEFFVSLYGQVFYGVTDSLSLGSLVSAAFLELPNASAKYRLYGDGVDRVSVMTQVYSLPDTFGISGNLAFLWTSQSSVHMLTHTSLYLATYTISPDSEKAVVRVIGSARLQSSFELIRSTWDRILFGPVYDISRQKIGGYLSYNWIWDLWQLQIGLNSVDIVNTRLRAEEGYSLALDMFWRF